MMASGTEVSIIVSAAKELEAEGIGVRLVSFPSWELFDSQGPNYQREVLPSEISARLAIEAGSSMGWHRWVGDRGVVISVDRYGASAPQKIVYEKYGLTVEQVISKAKEMLG
jgi:transketolase